MGWFTPRDTYERTIKDKETGEEATITLRPLNAGDRAELNEIRLLAGEGDEEGEGSIRAGRQQIRMVQLALVSWTIEQPVSAATIEQLDPRVFDQIIGHVSFGKPQEEKPQEEDVPVPLPVADSSEKEKEPVTVALS